MRVGRRGTRLGEHSVLGGTKLGGNELQMQHQIAANRWVARAGGSCGQSCQAEASCSMERSRSHTICAAKHDTAGMLHSSSCHCSRAGSGGRSRPAGGSSAAAAAATKLAAGRGGTMGGGMGAERTFGRRCSDSSTAVGRMNATTTWVHTVSARQAPGAGMRMGGPPTARSGLQGRVEAPGELARRRGALSAGSDQQLRRLTGRGICVAQ